MEDSDTEFRKEPCLIEENKITGSTGHVAYSQVLWLPKKWSSCDNLAVMGGSHPCDGTKAITEQGCSSASLWHNMGLPSLLLLQIGHSDTKKLWRFLLRWFQRCLLATTLPSFCLGLASVVRVLLSSCYSPFRLATSKTTTDFVLY